MKKSWIAELFASPLGTFIKGFLSIVLGMWAGELANGHDLFSMDVAMTKKLIVAGIVPNIHILINWFNPQYTAYGKNKLDAKIESVIDDPQMQNTTP